MSEAIADLERALELLSEGDEGTDHHMVLQGDIVDASLIAIHDGERATSPLYQRRFLHAREGFDSIVTLFERMEWMSRLYCEGHVKWDKWWHYTALDIELFHVLLRSLYDYLAQAIIVAADRPGQLGDAERASFQDLRGKLDKPSYRSRFDSEMGDLGELLKSCEWFDHVRRVRDMVVHKGGRVLLFERPPSLLFQCYTSGFRKAVGDVAESLMYNENVVDFRRYAGYVVGRTMSFMDRVAGVLLERTPGERISKNAYSWHVGYAVMQDWMFQARAAIADSGNGSIDRR